MDQPNMNMDALAEVFHNLELSDLLVIGIVCKQWFYAVTQCCSQIHSLTFLIGDGAVQLRDSSQEIFPSVRAPKNDRMSSYHLEWSRPDLSNENICKIVNLFTNVTHFEIALQLLSCYDIVHLVKLLDGWKDKLVCLKVTIERTNERWDDDLSRIFKTNAKILLKKLNQLTELKHLTLVFHNSIGPLLNLPVLDRLDQFNFFSPNDMQILFSSLVNHVKNDSAIRFDIRNKLSSGELLSRVEHMAGKFDRMSIVREFADQAQLNSITDKFTSLSTLSIRIGQQLSFNKLAQSLEKLNNLADLELFLNFREPNFVVWDKDVSKRTVPHLNPIKFLTLEVVTRKRDDLLAINFEWIFPSVNKVKFVDSQMQPRVEADIMPNVGLEIRWEDRDADPNFRHAIDEHRARNDDLVQPERDIALARLFRVIHLLDANMRQVEDHLFNDNERDLNQAIRRIVDNPFVVRMDGDGEEAAAEQPAFQVDEQHYDSLELRDQFIADYVRHLELSNALKRVEVYKRTRYDSEISPLLHSYAFNE